MPEMSKPRMYGMAGSMRKGGKRDPSNRKPRSPWTDKAGKSGQAYGSRNEMYAYICPDCGAYLDPGEKCDCRREEEKPLPMVRTPGAAGKRNLLTVYRYTEEKSMLFSHARHERR